MMRDDEADGDAGDHAGEPEQAGHKTDLPVRQPGRRADLGQERRKGTDRERAAEPIHRQERDERTAHGSTILRENFLGWAADRSLICGPAQVRLSPTSLLASVAATRGGHRHTVRNDQ